MRRPLSGTLLPSLAAALAVACSAPRPPLRVPPPDAEFLLSAGDSTFWVRTTPAGVHVRGVPMVLASWDRRLHEVYVSDDDRSYPDALFIGQLLFGRDLATGDSLLVFGDTAVPRAAREYAEANPFERPLDPDEEGNENPSVSVASELDVLDIYGPFLSFEYHLDVSTPEAGSWHGTRRGVLDLRTGNARTAGDLFGREEGARLVAAARAAYRATLDSVRRGGDANARRAVRSLAAFHFDLSSFSLADANTEPHVDFVAPGRGEGPSGLTLPLPRIAARPPGWWSEVRETLPVVADSVTVAWRRPGYRVLARYDSTGEVVEVAIADSTAREWKVASVMGPARSIFWLDRPPIDSVQRAALTRAFEEAVLYDEHTRSAALRSGAPPSPLRLAARGTQHAHPAR